MRAFSGVSSGPAKCSPFLNGWQPAAFAYGQG